MPSPGRISVCSLPVASWTPPRRRCTQCWGQCLETWWRCSGPTPSTWAETRYTSAAGAPHHRSLNGFRHRLERNKEDGKWKWGMLFQDKGTTDEDFIWMWSQFQNKSYSKLIAASKENIPQVILWSSHLTNKANIQNLVTTIIPRQTLMILIFPGPRYLHNPSVGRC